MGKKSAPTPPKPPDPSVVAAAQGEQNLIAMREGAKMNSPDQYTPYGNVIYTRDQYGVPTETHVTLTPNGQLAFDTSQSIAQQLMDQAQNQIGYLPGDAFQLPSTFNPSPYNYNAVNPNHVNPNAPTHFTGDTLNYGAMQQNYDGRVGQLQQALYDRRMDLMRPEFDRQWGDLEQNLADRGLPMSGAAYGRSIDRFNEARNNAMTAAANDAVSQAASYEQQLRQLDLAGQGQQFGQEIGAHQYNTGLDQSFFGQQLASAGQNFGQDAQAEGLYRSGQQDAFNMDLATQQQLTRDALLERNQPYQEALAYITGAPMAPAPDAPNLPAQYATPPNMGNLYGMQYDGQMAAYQAQLQQQQANLGGMYNLIGAFGTAFMSDERIKENIIEVGELSNGAKVYDFNYRGDPRRVRGFVAQQIETILPHAVLTTEGGLKAVYYDEVMRDAQGAI